jgi:outer membrane biosynthesis protein TonB
MLHPFTACKERRMTSLRKNALALALILTMPLSACDGCNKTEEVKPPEVVKTPEVVKEDPKPPEDPLKEAREDADKQAAALALSISGTCALVGAEIEGMNTKPTVVKTTKIKQIETGSIDAKAAAKLFRDYDGAMRKCYERSLKKSPGLEGQVNLSLVVNNDGKVKSARATGSLNDEVYTCIERIASEMTFPKPEGGPARVVKPYKFNPSL